MGFDFWAGIIIGFFLSVALTIVFWIVTIRVLVPKLVFSPGLAERKKADGTWSYWFTVSNVGRRDAVDVVISCTLFAEQWGTDPGWSHSNDQAPGHYRPHRYHAQAQEADWYPDA